MTPITLKTYQQTALDTLAAFARAARVKGPALAFGELAGRPWHAGAFGGVIILDEDPLGRSGADRTGVAGLGRGGQGGRRSDRCERHHGTQGDCAKP